ncbi:MAG: glutathione S-transferase family protein [Pseudomonadota bacterium]
MPKLFHAPGSCSNGILLLLEETGIAYETETIDLAKGANRAPDYLAQNPKGKVPALRTDDGEVVTEFPAVALCIATTYPQAGLWPDDPMARVRTLEMLDFIVGSIHMRGFTFVKMPQKFIDTAEGQAALRAHGEKEIVKGLTVMSDTLGAEDYMLGTFGLADVAAFYVLRWCAMDGVAMPDNLAALLARLSDRPAAQAVLPQLVRAG